MHRALAVLPPLMLALIPAADEPVAILKGTDPAQFELVGITPGSIAIVDGEVRLAGKPLGYFATKREYKDYVLTFEFQYDRPENLKSDADFRGNSGALLHIAGPPKVWPSCVQVQLAQADPGAIFAMNESRCEAGSDPLAQKGAIKAIGEWNKVQVTCQDGAISSVLNGVEVSKGEKAEPDHGAIGWQAEGKPVRFRDLRIRPLP
jgi:hypothetical protein